MTKLNALILLFALLLVSCNDYNKVLKSDDIQYNYEAAKDFFVRGQYAKTIGVLGDILVALKGSTMAEEAYYMMAMAYYYHGDWEEASNTFKRYARTYPHGTYPERAYYYACLALCSDTPDARLDQSSTIQAISDIQLFCEMYPHSELRYDLQSRLFGLQEKLVEKEYHAAKLYFSLGNYMGNNYQSCIITAQNALRDYPFTDLREDLSWLVLQAKYEMAVESVEYRQAERYREAIDEYYAYKNEFPDGKYLKEAEKIYHHARKYVKD